MLRKFPIAMLKVSIVALAVTLTAAAAGISLNALPLPGGEHGIGFDDMGFAPSIHKVLVPAGRSGNLDLIDPETGRITAIGGFSSHPSFSSGHSQGVTSADEGRGLLFATDRDAKRLDVVDPMSGSVVASSPLASGPDYVRYVSATAEVWVTEPSASRIEVFSLPAEGPPKPVHLAFIAVPGGPESLIIDNNRDRAYTHLWTDTTLAIDVKSHEVLSRWKNGCRGSRGIALDGARGFLLVGCEEGKLSVLDSRTGALLGQASSGNGVDIISYSPRLSHAYLPGETSGTMAIIGISDQGKATVLATIKTVEGAHCVASDDRGNAYVCDPDGGRLLVVKDFIPTPGR